MSSVSEKLCYLLCTDIVFSARWVLMGDELLSALIFFPRRGDLKQRVIEL